MKTVETLSAFSVYKQLSGKDAPKKPLLDRIAKKKSKFKLAHRKPKLNKNLNSAKVLLGIKQNDVDVKIKNKLDKVQTSSLEDKNQDQEVNSAMVRTPTVLNVENKTKIKNQESKTQTANKLPKKSSKHSLKSKQQTNSENMGDTLKPENTSTAQNVINIPYSYCDPSPSGQDPIMKGFQLFEWMIAPIKPQNFFYKYWETESLHIARNNKKYYAHLLTSRHLDQIFRENSLYYTKNVDVVVYENEEKQVLNPEGRANPSAVWDFYSNGCSIRVLNPQTYNKKVHLLVSTLQEYFGSMVGVNVYLTPPGSQGFAPHFDDIEAFVIQLEGRKHWKLYKPKEEDMLARYSSKNFKHEEIGDPFQEITLEAGSLLYFPRGIIHEGITDAESHSLHITVSLYQNNAYIDLLEKALPSALMKAAKSDIDFRKGLPLHFLRRDNAKQTMAKKLTELLDKLKDYLEVEVGINELGRKLVYDSMPPVLSAEEIACSSKQDGDMLDEGIVYNKVEFDLATKIRLTRYHCIQLIVDETCKPKLYYSTENSNVYHGEEEQWLELDPVMVPAIEALRKAYPSYIGIGFLPIEGVELKVQFVYDLWEKGIVITKEPLSSNSSSKNDTSITQIELSD